MNLIQNPSFESDWSEGESHRCLVCPRTEPNYYRDVGNIFVPPKWTFWFRHQPGSYDQPEGRDAWKQNAPERVRSGEKAYMWFTFSRRHDAGLFQQVEVGAESKVRFTLWAHAWSNGLDEDDGGHLDDGLWSDGTEVGYDQVAWEVGTRPLTGDKQDDAESNFAFWVGIDPAGGTDPYAEGVVWGRGYYIYNGYVRQLVVEATAESDTVTVFVRSKTRFAFKHNDAYVDDAELVIVEEPPTPPPPPEERGKPRVQYLRTYVLLPPNADAHEASIVADETWNQRRFTIGGSADDAGVGDLDSRNVLALNPHEWPDDLETFFETHYEGVKYSSFVYTNDTQLRQGLRDYVGFTPVHPSVPVGINDPQYQGAGEWMRDEGVRTILYIPWALDYTANHFDFSILQDAGIRVYVNLRFSWASADGGQGTLPLLKHQTKFEDACVDTILNSKGVYAWSLTNEANSPREWPKLQDGSLETITPARLAAFFASVRERVYEDADELPSLSLGGFDPFNVESGLDPREWTRATWELLGNYRPNFIDVHGYIRGPDADLIGSWDKFPAGKLEWQYLNFPKCYETLLDAMPGWTQGLPIIVSEFNHLWKTVEPDWGWVNDERATGVVESARRYLENRARSGWHTTALCLYRWKGDAWAIHDNEFVKQALTEKE